MRSHRSSSGLTTLLVVGIVFAAAAGWAEKADSGPVAKGLFDGKPFTPASAIVFLKDACVQEGDGKKAPPCESERDVFVYETKVSCSDFLQNKLPPREVRMENLKWRTGAKLDLKRDKRAEVSFAQDVKGSAVRGGPRAKQGLVHILKAPVKAGEVASLKISVKADDKHSLEGEVSALVCERTE